MRPISLSSFDTPDATWAVRRVERIPAPPERVWKALVTPEELRGWWCDEADVECRPGGRYVFAGRHVLGGGAGDLAGGDGFRIVDLSEPERLEFTWPLGGVETRVVYELRNLLEITELVVTQTGDAEPAWETDGETPDWWWVALPALRSFVENGRADLRVDFEAVADAPLVEFSVGVYTFPWIIWSKLTDPAQLDRWIGHGASVEEGVGGRFELGLGDLGPTRISGFEPGRRLAHDWRWQDGVASDVEWTIEETDDATRVTVRDAGPWPGAMRRDFLAVHWAARLLDLKQMSQRGVTPREYQAG